MKRLHKWAVVPESELPSGFISWVKHCSHCGMLKYNVTFARGTKLYRCSNAPACVGSRLFTDPACLAPRPCPECRIPVVGGGVCVNCRHRIRAFEDRQLVSARKRPCCQRPGALKYPLECEACIAEADARMARLKPSVLPIRVVEDLANVKQARTRVFVEPNKTAVSDMKRGPGWSGGYWGGFSGGE